MQHAHTLIAAASKFEPLTPRELVTNDELRRLAEGEASWQQGEISEEFQSILVMVLPDICGELIARRAAMLKDATIRNRHPSTTIAE